MGRKTKNPKGSTKAFRKQGPLCLKANGGQKGFAVAPILYLLMMAGVAAGVLFSGYSQILRANLNVTNATTAKNELSGAMTTLAATGILSTDQTLFCPPRGSGASAACIDAPVKLVAFGSAEAGKLPASTATASSSGSPTEVGVFAAGAGVKQLDPWGRYYVYCRWENARATPDQSAVAIITAGANGTVETTCADEAPGGDDQLIRATVGEAINRASVWQQEEDATEASFGAPGTKVTVTAEGVIEAQGLILADTATINALSLTTPLPIGSGGTGATTAASARSNLGSGTTGDALFLAGSAADARTTLGATTVGDYLFSSSSYIEATASAARSDLLGAGAIGNDMFLAATATEGRAVLGSTTMGDYLFSASTLDGTLATQVRSTLLGASTIGDAVFTAASTDTALTALGGTTVGKAVFTASDEGTARTGLGAGAEGSLLFTATSQLHAWQILGLTGTLNPYLDISISGSADSVPASGITGEVPIAHGGTSANNASDALDNLFSGDSSPSSTLNASRIQDYSLTSTKMTSIVTAGTYNEVTVDAAGRVTAGTYIAYSSDTLTDGLGDGILATATGGGYLYFSTASAIQMTLSPLGYLGLGTQDPKEKLHVNNGNIRISGPAETSRELQFTTGESSGRWVVAANDEAESGSSAGSNFAITRVSDGGSEVTAMTISRASGAVNFAGQVSSDTGFLGFFTGTFSGTFTGSSILGSTVTQTSPHRSGDQTTGLYSDAAYNVAIATAGVERLRVTGTGSVGIGVSDPEYNLDVSGSARTNLVHFTGTTTGTGVIAGTATGGAGAVQYSDGSGNLAGDAYLTWDSANRYLAIGTTTPRADLDMGYKTGALILPSGANGTRPTSPVEGMIRYNDSSHTFEGYQGASATWSEVGGGTIGIYLGTATTNANPRRADDQTTGFFSDGAGAVAFSAAGVEVLRITATGSVGMNNGTPDYPLQIGTTAADGAGAFLSAAGVWTNASDRRLKENIRPLSYGLADLMKLAPVAYEMKGTQEKQIGFIAQDVAEVLPEVVSVSRAGHYGLSYGNMVAVVVKAVQELEEKVAKGSTAEMHSVNLLLVALLLFTFGLVLAVWLSLRGRIVRLEKELAALHAAKGDTALCQKG